MNALDFSALSGSLVVRKNVAGDVSISTQPQIVISDSKPTVVAIGGERVREVIDTTNVRALVERKLISVVA